VELHPEAEVRLVQRQSHRDAERRNRGERQSQDGRQGLPDRSAQNRQNQDAWDAWDAVHPDERQGIAPERPDSGIRPDRSAVEA